MGEVSSEVLPMIAENMQERAMPSGEWSCIPGNGGGEQIDSDGDSVEEDIDFNWDEYLEETSGSAAPHTSFKHVEISLQSSFQPGMKLEVANKSNPDTYWVATIITTCRQLLLLRFSGYGDDRKADFWCDVMTADLHPVGWCAQNNKVLMPPEAIKEKYTDWTEFLIQELTGSRTAPANLLEGPLRGKNTVDLIMLDSLVELQDSQNPFQYWIVRVIENIGGRLRLRYFGLDCDTHDKWLFYLDFRLRPVGWCLENRYSMEPPTEIRGLRAATDWKDTLERALTEAAKNPLPLEVFKDHADLQNHLFSVGLKLEMLDSQGPFCISPATVTKASVTAVKFSSLEVYNDQYFHVTIDDLAGDSTPSSLLCHAESPGILPVEWCLKNGVNLTRPKGYLSQDFDWADYLKQCGTEAAPHLCFRNTSLSRGFSKNMKLEAVNPVNPAEICVATIIKVKGRLMWLHLEGLKKPFPEYIVDVESMDIFPVGWCEANGYHLTPPHRVVCQTQKKIAVVQPEKQLLISVPVENVPHNICPNAPLDTDCLPLCLWRMYLIISVPMLHWILVLGMLINAAYKPGRVLRELQLVEDPQGNFQEETLKAKYKGKTYRSTIKIVRTTDQVSEFCRKVCLKLQCCPNLFSPALVTDKCPENCSIHTKTKYTYYYGKKKKVIKPTIGDSCVERSLTKPARRRKKRKSIFVQKKRRSSAVDYTPAASPQDSEEDEDQDGPEDDTGSEETSSEQREDQTDTSSVEVLTTRPRRAAALRRNTDTARPTSIERSRRKRTTRSLSYTEDIKYHPAKRSAAKDIDGQALLLLTLPTVQECMELKLGPAIKLCHQIERVKVAFYAQYAN
ncbi:UNVERIFIED_CONTAM: hypothetical protein FKN15_035174 [Acipenser sinensis]